MSIKNTLAKIENAIPAEAKIPEWQPIINKVTLPEPPPFPVQALPAVLHDLTMEVSNSIKVPPALAAAAILAYVGLAIGRNICYYLKRGVSGRSNLYMLIFAARGERKSSVESLLKKPFDQWLIAQSKIYNQAMTMADMAVDRRNHLSKQLAKAKNLTSGDSDKIREEIQAINNSLEGLPPNPNIFSNNITQEALLQKLASCGGTTAIFADDGRAILKMITGKRYSKDGDAQDDVFLDAFDGSKTLSYDRSGRSIKPIERPCIGLMLMMQPDMLMLLSEKEELFDSGFSSRCLFCFPETWVGKRNADGSLKRDFDDVELSDETMNRYSELIVRLMNRSYNSYGEEPQFIGLSNDAKAFWAEHYREVEGESGEGGIHYDTLAVAIRYPTQTLRIALLISQVHEHDQITIEDIKNAHSIMRYFIANAEHCYFYMKEMSLPGDAWKIIRYWTRKLVASGTSREMYHAVGAMTAARFDEMIAILAKRNFCRRVKPIGKNSVGRSESDTIEVNPELLQSDLYF